MQAAELEAQTAELEEQKEEASALADELQAANEELQRAVEEADTARETAERAAAATAEAYRELDQFAYVASHDLKAPLRGIANLAQWIRDDLGETLPEQSAEHLGLLQGRVHRMEALIEGILAYSRAGRVVGKLQRIDTGALVGEIVELLAPPPGVTISVAKDMPVLDAERVPLEQVFMNLIGNAVKYAGADRQEAHVSVSWRDLGEAFEFAVQDDGPGIAPEFHERIWAIFQTLAARDKVEGTGIGLSVVKKVIETRGGRVSVESAPGRGATFRFTWPKRLKERIE
jgi:signal transduction histidine kinase